MDPLTLKYESIKTKADLIDFIELLVTDLKENPAEWENKTLEDYLHAMISCTEDLEGFYHNKNLPVPENINWRAFANILVAAKMYE